MLDDRVCPSCQVLLPEGMHICPKCGKQVAAPKTGLALRDLPRKVYTSLVEYFGQLGAVLIAVVVFLLLLVLIIGLVMWKFSPAP
jgi:hypothetical protein